MDRFAVLACLPFLAEDGGSPGRGCGGRVAVEWSGWARLHVTEDTVATTVDAPTAPSAAHPMFGRGPPGGPMDAELMRAAVRVDIDAGRVRLELDGRHYRMSLRTAGRVLCCSLCPAAGADGWDALLGPHPAPACLLEVPRASSTMPFASVLFPDCGINFVHTGPARARHAAAADAPCRINGVEPARPHGGDGGADELGVRVLATALAAALEQEVHSAAGGAGGAPAAAPAPEESEGETRLWAAAAALADAVVDGEPLERVSALVADVASHRDAIA